MRKAWEPLAKIDLHAEKKILGQLAESQAAELTYQQTARLDELFDLCETLGLASISAWPNVDEYDEWFRPWLDLAVTLGGFDRALLSAEASLTLERIDALPADAPRYPLTDEGRERTLNQWDQVLDQEAAVRLLVRTLYRGRDAAWTAACALQYTPKVDLAIQLLDEAMPDLRSSTPHQEIAAKTLIVLSHGSRLESWITDSDPVLQALAVEFMDIDDLMSSPARIRDMLKDADGRVVEAVVGRIRQSNISELQDELRRIANEPEPARSCTNCGHVNPQGTEFCQECRRGGPRPSAAAKAILEGRPMPGKVLFSLGRTDADEDDSS